MKRTFAWNAAIALSVLALPAYAQEPAGLLSTEQTTTGSTEVAQGGFQSAARPADDKNFLALELMAGGLLAAGNAQTLAYTAAGNFQLRRDMNQLGVRASANFARSSGARLDDGTLPPMEDTLENYQGLIRYDRFFSKVVSGFVQVSALNDPFQGLDLRLNVDPGIAIYVIDDEREQLSFDVGYDLQYENWTTAAGDDDDTLHSLRLAVRYSNNLNEAVMFSSGVEYLQALSPYEREYREPTNLDTEDQQFGDQVFRVNWSVGANAKLTAKVSDKFSIATALDIRHDNSPIELNYAMTDILTSVNLVYSMF